MAEALDTSKGWCCDGRTHAEHEEADGECCQPEGKQIADLPADGQAAANERMAKDGAGEDEGETSEA
jgi:hypothetical protein